MADSLANTQGRVREWIGPRIIPVFADEVEWDDESTYEPLMMVQNQGETFMSRQFVPAGAPLPNTESGQESTDYWVHMSNWNAQVEGYREEVMRYAQEVLLFDGRIDSLEDALPIADFDSTSTVKDAIDDLGALLPATAFDSTNTVDARFDTIEADAWVTALRIAADAVTTAKIADENVTTAKLADGSVTTGKIADANITTAKIADSAVTNSKIADGAITKAKMQEEYFVLFGDSWCAFDSGYENWYSLTGIGKVLDVTLKNYAVGGAGFIGGSSLISSQLTTANGNMTADEKARTKYVCIVGGINDVSNSNPGVSSYSTWYNAVTNILDQAHIIFPNALILYAPDCCSRSHGAYKKAEMIHMCLDYKNLHMPYITSPCVFVPNLPYFWVGHGDAAVFKSDGLHLNTNGAEAFGKQILAACTGQTATPTQAVYIIDDLKWNYDCYGNCSLNGTYVFSGTSQITLSSTSTDFTEWVDAFATYIKGTRIWSGISANADYHAWIRYATNNSITGRAEAAITYYF